MFEVIIERPRLGRDWRRKGRPPRDLDDARRYEPMGRGGTKMLNENLAPLIRFLQRRAGRPWDEVHSEIAAHLSLKSAVQKHVLDHVWQMVEVNPIMIDGKPFHPDYSRQPIESGRRPNFYVCPLSRRLLIAPRRGRPLPEPPRDRVKIDGGTEAWRLDGVWYGVRFSRVPAAREHLRDVLLKRFLDEGGMLGWGGALQKKYGRDDRYAAAKWQLGKREIARLARR